MTLYHNKYIQPEEDEPIAEHRHHRLKVHKHEIFFLLFLQKPKPYGPKGL